VHSVGIICNNYIATNTRSKKCKTPIFILVLLQDGIFVWCSFMCYMLFDDVGETEHCVCFASLSAIIGTKRMCSVCGHFTQSLARSVTQSLTHSHSNSITRSLAHSITRSLAHSITRSLSHSITRSISHSITRSLSHSITRSLSHSITRSLRHCFHDFPIVYFPVSSCGTFTTCYSTP